MPNYDSAEFADNPEPRCHCVLLLDTSGSMVGQPIAQLNEGLKIFRDDLSKDTHAMLRVEVTLITFGSEVRAHQDCIHANEFVPPVLQASGGTSMGQAIHMGLDKIEERKRILKENEIARFRPWMFLITDGEPTDEWRDAARRLQVAEKNESVLFFAIGVQNANLNTLKQISGTEPKQLAGLCFGELFKWLSTSLQNVSHSNPGDKITLPPTDHWASLEV